MNTPPVVDSNSHPPSPVFRPRSNSVTSHPYAGPYFGSGRSDRTESINGERRTSVGWLPPDQVAQTSRLRKRGQEQGDVVDRQSRLRTASISSAEESRPVPGWADARDKLGLPMPASSQSSPVEHQGPRRGSIDSGADTRRSSADSGRSHAGATSDRSDVSPRMTSHPSIEQYGRPQHHIAPELAAMHITSPEAWRGLTSAAPLTHLRLGPSTHAPTAAPAMPSHPPYSTWAPGPINLTSGPLPPSSTSNSVFAGPQAMDDGGDSQAEVGRYGCPHCRESQESREP